MSTAAVAILLATPVAGGAVGPELYAGGPGNQSSPSISATHLAYLDDSSGKSRVHYKRLDPTDEGKPVPSTDFGQGAPRLYGTYLAYRVPGQVKLFDATAGEVIDEFDAAGMGQTALAASFVAWEQEAADGGDVAWQRFGAPKPVVVSRPGRQHGVAAAVDWLAYIDDYEAGTVRLVDTRDGSDTVVYSGAPLEVAIWAAEDGSQPVLAVTVAGASGTEILILESKVAGGPLELGARLAGGQTERVNPRLSGLWVAFEEVVREPGSGVVISSLVALWNRSGERLYMPAPRGSLQELNDLIASPDSVVVVWADDFGGDFDVYLQTIALVDGLPSVPGQASARCDDPAATVLADFTVVEEDHTRGHVHHRCDLAGHDALHDEDDRHHGDSDGHHCDDDGHHQDHDGHHDGHHSWRGFDRLSAEGALFPADGPTPVLVCIDASGVTFAWVAAGSQVVASPADFHGGTAKLEGRLVIAAGDGRAGAVIAGDPGASLRVRVLADPGGNGNGSTDSSTCLARGDCPPPPRRLERASTFSCGTPGDAGPLGLLLLAGLFGVGRAGRRIRR